jgi:hypothetical protein
LIGHFGGITVIRLRGRFDGHQVVLEQPPPAGLQPDTPVEVIVLTDREQALRGLTEFLTELWQRTGGPAVPPSHGRQWTREDLYERGGKGLS